MATGLPKTIHDQQRRGQLSLGDRLLAECDHMLHTLFAGAASERISPAVAAGRQQPDVDSDLTTGQRQQAVEFMRINHTGEVCAQALYRGQALLAQDPATHTMLLQAGAEEQDHLSWCEQRVQELGGRTSYLAPFFYMSSLAIGAVAALCGDKVSMGFIAETEQQVESHLAGHAARLSGQDKKSQAVISQMIADEARHAKQAREHHAATLPKPIRCLMRAVSQVMTQTTRWV